jgi:hydroxymethylglutaryl-CoA lyase
MAYVPKFLLGGGKIPKKVRLGDITMRDGFQHEERYIHPDAKVWCVEQAIKCGFKDIEVTNFGNPKVVPQFADCWEVMERAARLREKYGWNGVFTGVSIDYKAAENVVAMKKEGKKVPDRLLVMASTSEPHQFANSGRSHKEYLGNCERVIPLMRDAGFEVCGTVSTIWGCPVAQSATDLDWAVELTEIFLRMGASDIEHADHDGQGNPIAVYDYFARIMDRFPNPDLHVAHFHVTRGYGLANVLAALQAGITRFEATFGGIGGQPANFLDGRPVKGTGKYYYTNPNAVGLVEMLDMLVMFNGMGIDHGINMELAFEYGHMVEKICGRKLRSESLHFGDLPKYGEIKTTRDFSAAEYKAKYPKPLYPVPGVPEEVW